MLPNDKPTISVENLSLNYITQKGILPALRNVNFSLKKGEILGLVGESGSGKSTVAFSIIGHLPENACISNGRIFFLNEEILKKNPEELRRIRSKNIAMVYQDPMSSLNPSLTIGFQLSEIISNCQIIDSKTAQLKCVEYLKKVHIPDAEESAHKFQHQMSGGQLQRVVIAMALCRNPELLIMDEPTTGLDVTTEATILDLVNELKIELNSAILFISHNLGVIAKVADHVGVLYAGQMIEKGETKEVFKNPLHPYTMALMECIPTIDIGKRKGLKPINGIFPDLTNLHHGCIFYPRCPFREDRCNQEPITCKKIDESRETACLRWKELYALKMAVSENKGFGKIFHDNNKLTDKSNKKVLIKVNHLKKFYGSSNFFKKITSRKANYTKAVDDVSFCIYDKDVLGIVGESGCGKSTLGSAIIKLIRPTEGGIYFKQKDLWHMSNIENKAFKKQCQIVFQNPDSSLNPKKTVGEILERPLILYNCGTPKQRKQRVFELLNMVRMETRYFGLYPYELSGGEKQRIGIARAFAAEPSLVVCDEPLSALDVSVQASILNLLIELQKKFSTAYLFISHDLSVVKYISNSVCVMYLGIICEIGNTERVFSRPFHPYTDALLSAVPTIQTNQHKELIRLKGSVPSAKNIPSGCRFHTRCPKKIGNICELESPKGTSINGSKIVYCHLFN